LAAQPDSPTLNFALGNLYAQQGRWNDAQQAYFRAFAGDGDNPDYQFNLASASTSCANPSSHCSIIRGRLLPPPSALPPSTETRPKAASANCKNNAAPPAPWR
jgi:tetratricopeptide (TPR) repeat protein